MIEHVRNERGGANALPGFIAMGAAVVATVVFMWSSYYTVDQGERAVILHWGAMVDESEPGLHFKYPFVTSVIDIPVRQETISWQKSGEHGDNRLEVYTKDQQPVFVSVSIIYHVTNVTDVYAHYASRDGLEANLIEPQVPQQVKNVFGQFTAISAIQDRAQLDREVQNAIRSVIRGPLSIDSIQLADIEFSQSYEQAVEGRMQAIVAQQQAEAEKQKRITNADAAAYEVKAAADARAHQIEVQGQAEASAIKARGDALRDNPQMPQLVAAERWDGHLPTTMPPGGALPFLNLGK
jgi:regulator of protease activity HflC (stomatin/prohibitin superfamily)